MRGVYLTFVASPEGHRRLVPRLEDHVILPELSESDVLVQVKACGLSRIDTKTYLELNPGVEQIPVGLEISGVATKVGSAVKRFTAGVEVTGVLPLDTECPGCAEYCVVPEYCLVSKPTSVSHTVCAASLSSGARALSSLHHLTRLKPGAIVLICSASSGDGLTLIQMCEALGAKVIAAVDSAEGADFVKKHYPSLLRVIDLSTSHNVVEACLQETGGLGVNCIIDNIGVSPNYALSDFLIESVPLKRQLQQEMRRYGYEAAVPSAPLPTKHQLISCLASRGHWVTSQPDLQLDPPESQLLFLRGASLHFLFEPVWALSSAQQGDYLTILQTIVEKLETGILRPHVYKTVVLDQVCDELLRLGSYGIGKIVMRTNTQR